MPKHVVVSLCGHIWDHRNVALLWIILPSYYPTTIYSRSVHLVYACVCVSVDPQVARTDQMHTHSYYCITKTNCLYLGLKKKLLISGKKSICMFIHLYVASQVDRTDQTQKNC